MKAEEEFLEELEAILGFEGVIRDLLRRVLEWLLQASGAVEAHCE
jgi:hypothetical protein